MATDESKIDKLDNLDRKAVLAYLDPSQYSNVTITMLDDIKKHFDLVIYITISKSFDVILRNIHDRKMSDKNIIFIDAVTKTIASGNLKADNVFFVDTPEDLTGMSITITQVLKAAKGEHTAVIIDSLQTLLNFNSDEEVLRFMTVVVNKVKKENALFIFATDKNDAILKKVFPLIDETISGDK
ncbi:MAG: hypothetical protein Q8O89_03930 [Nanoarchaeota archaeon]|nr:hypothetical protein [Nanoarchaeota archaeon]